ncbi:hypothetical protein [Actinomadura sp. HBU206391]|uniref:hypothetical protein n=1 Tax=Actinomadura sp. HBU206391 TaxID=2731692 RepID=UPI001650472D|nr:hypothetical protein [Actinomadura sp. HBU206391]MBC6456964.1 hypothetical protein [Actinomadura sp. HBU206391]
MSQALDPRPPVVTASADAGRPSRRNLTLLAVVAAGYAAAQLALGMHRVFLGWDEILYVTQFSREVPPGFMDAPRAWGVPLIVAPVAALDASTEVIRGYVIALSSIGVFYAFRPWLRLRDTSAVPLAALLLCTLWVSVFYGNAAMPNMFTALCTVAAVALFVRAGLVAGAPEAGPAIAGLVAAFGVMSVVRPVDTVWIALPLVVTAFLSRRRRLQRLGAILAGSAIGWVPWIIEAHLRFGGLLPRVAQIARWNGDGLHVQVLRHLQSFGSGTLLCTSADSTCGRVTVGAGLVWFMLTVLAVTGLLALRGSAGRRPALIAVMVAAANAVPYFFFSQLANPRFLLPTYALLALPAGEGLRLLSRHLRPVGPAVAAGIVVLLVAAQLTMAHGMAREMREARREGIQQAHAISRLPVRPPCVIYGTNAAQIAYLTQCRYWRRYVHGVPRRAPAREIEPIFDRMRARGLQVVVVTRSKRSRDFPAGWRHMRLRPDRGWHAHLPPP